MKIKNIVKHWGKQCKLVVLLHLGASSEQHLLGSVTPSCHRGMQEIKPCSHHEIQRWVGCFYCIQSRI